MSNVLDFMLKPKFKSQVFTATAGQTVFVLTTITIPDADQEKSILIVNGKEQPYSAYTINSSTQFSIPEGVELNDHVELKIVSY
jgi:hypothetical protein